MTDNVKLLKNLFGSMQEAIFLGDPLKEGRFACFMQPGELVPTDIQENDSSKDMFLQSVICNKVIDTYIVNRFDKEGFGGNKELLGSTDELYGQILTRNSVPIRELTDAEEERLEVLRRKMARMESSYEFYRKQENDIKFLLLVEMKKQSPNETIVADLREKLVKARKNWNVMGYKRDYEAAYADLMRIMRVSPSVYMQELSDLYDSHRRSDINGNNYLQTFLSIPVSSWGSTRWNTFDSLVSEKDEYHYSKSTSWSASASGRWGLWSAGGGTSGSTQYVHDKTSATTIHLKFEYITVRILRDWMRETLLQERFWTWSKQWGGSLFSNGGAINADPPVRPIGKMPVLVNQLVVARNVEISGDFHEEEMTYYRNEINARGSVGWGPFSISGRYNSVTEEKRVAGSVGQNEIKMNHPQVIAKMGILMPQCPNPDRSLPFDPDDAWFPEHGLDKESISLLKRAVRLDDICQKQAGDEALAEIEIAEIAEKQKNELTEALEKIREKSEDAIKKLSADNP